MRVGGSKIRDMVEEDGFPTKMIFMMESGRIMKGMGKVSIVILVVINPSETG